MKGLQRLNIMVTITVSLALLIIAIPADAESYTMQEDPLQVLMITGGGWHDYDVQHVLLEEELSKRVNLDFTIDYTTGTDADAIPEIHQNDDWASEYDLVLYNSCHSGVEDVEYIEGVVDAHVENQLPAVVLHCSMHTYRGDTMKWFEFVGARSHRHESHQPFTVELLEPSHPITVNFPSAWRTPHGELYEIVELMPGATPLIRAYGIDRNQFHPLAWTHEYEGVRVFSTTLGHHNVTMGSDVNLNLVASGLLWAAGLLNEDGSPAAGYEGERELGWISLFDGETLDGWRASENSDSFTVEDGRIVVDGPRSHLNYAGPIDGGDFKNFEFKTDVYTYPQANSGIFFHTRYQHLGWPQHGYEAQVNASHSDRRKTGSLYAVSDVMDNAPHEDEEWFEYYMRVAGNDIRFDIDGETVLQFTEPDDREGTISLDRGTISLQAHDPDSRIYYRNLMIRLWPD
ncbi:MAG: family 16 glycoside hydrolase [Balneolaceae bacterium]